MTDTKKLREFANGHSQKLSCEDIRNAADEIERLRTALEWIAHRCPKIYEDSLDDPHRAHVEAAVDAGNCARAAVSENGESHE